MDTRNKCHLIREFVKSTDIKMCEVGTDSNTTDPLTKPLTLIKHVRHVGVMSIRFTRAWLL